MTYGLTEVDPVLCQHPCDPNLLEEDELYFPFAGAEVDVYTTLFQLFKP